MRHDQQAHLPRYRKSGEMTTLDDRGWRGVVDPDPPRTLFDAAEERPLAPETIEARFQAFHAQFPEVYDKLVQFSLELLNAGWEHFGIALIFERVRYETMLGASSESQPWRLNNSFRSRYARLIADQVPELADVFTLRKLSGASRPPRSCGECARGQCRNCLGSSCAHECDIAVML